MIHTETSISDTVNQIMASPAPILFPDTCALVDLIRVPYRTKKSKEAGYILKAASYLVSSSQNIVPNLWVVILPGIYKEWREHSQNTKKELTEHWSKLDATIEIAHASANAVNIALPSAIIYSDLGIENILLGLSEKFLSNAIFISTDSDCVNRAYLRLLNKEAPSQKGGEMKDCTIIEHCLELCKQLRNVGFTKNCVFNTSNTKDFCRPSSSELQVPLNVQFDAVNLTLTTKWQWAKAVLNV